MSKSLRNMPDLHYHLACKYAKKDRSSQGHCIGNDTYIRFAGGRGAVDDVEVVYHRTAVLTFHPDDTVTLNSGGWRTPTTALRIKALLPRGTCLSSYRGVWLWDNIPFYDGMRVDLMGNLLSAMPKVCDEVLQYADAQIDEARRKVEALRADPVFKAKLRLGALAPKWTRSISALLTNKLTANAVQELALNEQFTAYPAWRVFVVQHRIEQLIRKGEIT